MNYLELLQLAAPEAVLAVTALALLAVDLLGLRGVERPHRVGILLVLACAGCAAAIGLILAFPQHASLPGAILALDPVRSWVRVGLLVLTALTLLLSTEHDITPHWGEYFAVILLATIGMLFLVSSEDLLMIFVSLELTSLSLYVLAAFHKERLLSAEAALKYFLFGSVSAAFTLFGLSLVYGVSGATSLAQVAASIHSPHLDPLLLLAIVMVAVGFAFKVAAAPFHLWAPDVYEGAPAISAALIASGSKLAGFFVFARVMVAGFAGAEGSAGWHAFKPGWVPVVSVLAAASMFLGNITALAQNSVRRLLAYSAIAHAGYLLLGVISSRQQGVAAVIYYASTYALTTLGAFGVVAVVQTQTGSDQLQSFAGLSRRSPFLAACMLIFMLSLAGMPPLAGFFGKFYVFAAALRLSPGMDLLWLVILALVLSAVSLYYYVQVLKKIYVAEPEAGTGEIRISKTTAVVLALTALLVVVLGCMPQLLVHQLEAAVSAAGW